MTYVTSIFLVHPSHLVQWTFNLKQPLDSPNLAHAHRIGMGSHDFSTLILPLSTTWTRPFYRLSAPPPPPKVRQSKRTVCQEAKGSHWDLVKHVTSEEWWPFHPKPKDRHWSRQGHDVPCHHFGNQATCARSPRAHVKRASSAAMNPRTLHYEGKSCFQIACVVFSHSKAKVWGIFSHSKKKSSVPHLPEQHPRQPQGRTCHSFQVGLGSLTLRCKKSQGDCKRDQRDKYFNIPHIIQNVSMSAGQRNSLQHAREDRVQITCQPPWHVQ